jgi:hypothetical protein
MRGGGNESEMKRVMTMTKLRCCLELTEETNKENQSAIFSLMGV